MFKKKNATSVQPEENVDVKVDTNIPPEDTTEEVKNETPVENSDTKADVETAVPAEEPVDDEANEPGVETEVKSEEPSKDSEKKSTPFIQHIPVIGRVYKYNKFIDEASDLILEARRKAKDGSQTYEGEKPASIVPTGEAKDVVDTPELEKAKAHLDRKAKDKANKKVETNAEPMADAAFSAPEKQEGKIGDVDISALINSADPHEAVTPTIFQPVPEGPVTTEPAMEFHLVDPPVEPQVQPIFQPMPGQPVPPMGQPMPGQPIPGQPPVFQTADGKIVTPVGQPVPPMAQPAPSQPIPGQPDVLPENILINQNGEPGGVLPKQTREAIKAKFPKPEKAKADNVEVDLGVNLYEEVIPPEKKEVPPVISEEIPEAESYYEPHVNAFDNSASIALYPYLKEIEDMANGVGFDVAMGVISVDGKPSGIIECQIYLNGVFNPFKSFMIDNGNIIDHRKKFYPVFRPTAPLETYNPFLLYVQKPVEGTKRREEILNKDVLSKYLEGGVDLLDDKQRMYSKTLLILNSRVALISMPTKGMNRESSRELRDRLITLDKAGAFVKTLQYVPGCRLRITEYDKNTKQIKFSNDGCPPDYLANVPDAPLLEAFTDGDGLNMKVYAKDRITAFNKLMGD